MLISEREKWGKTGRNERVEGLEGRTCGGRGGGAEETGLVMVAELQRGTGCGIIAGRATLYSTQG